MKAEVMENRKSYFIWKINWAWVEWCRLNWRKKASGVIYPEQYNNWLVGEMLGKK